MRKASILVNNIKAGILEEFSTGEYQFTYHNDYHGAPVSLTMPVTQRKYLFAKFPSFFEG
jgi:serine/threonine-protein kinase HipA